MSNETVTLNDNLHKIDSVLTALNYLLEEVETRKKEMLTSSNVKDTVKEVMVEYDFQNSISRYFNNNYGEGLTREVAFNVMRQIDNDIEAFINDRVNKALMSAGVTVPSAD